MLVIALGACSTDPGQGDQFVAVPTQSPPPVLQVGPQACPLALLEGTLVRHEDAGIAVQGDPQFPAAIVAWPHGWVARDVGEVRELLDDAARVVGREGDRFSAGGGFVPPREWFHPCGQIEITPAE